MRKGSKAKFDYFVDIAAWPFTQVEKIQNRLLMRSLWLFLLLAYGLPVVYPALIVIGIPLVVADVIREGF